MPLLYFVIVILPLCEDLNRCAIQGTQGVHRDQAANTLLYAAIAGGNSNNKSTAASESLRYLLTEYYGDQWKLISSTDEVSKLLKSN